jgi:hypothetical protein
MRGCTFNAWLRLETDRTAAGPISAFNPGSGFRTGFWAILTIPGNVMKLIVAGLVSVVALSAAERAYAQTRAPTLIEDSRVLQNYPSSDELDLSPRDDNAGSSMRTIALQRSAHHPAGTNAVPQPIAVFGADDRRTEEAYARENGMSVAEVQKRYAANGRLICDKAILNANLVLVNDLIVTSAHAFSSSEYCKKRSTPKNCSFEARLGAVKIRIGVSRLESIGFRCEKTSTEKQSMVDDWAVLRLKNELKGIVPFSISNGESMKGNSTVTAVSSINVDFFPNGKQASQFVKSIGSCLIHKLYRKSGDVVFFSSDCDGAEGSSGSALLDDSSSTAPVLLGILQGGNETGEQLTSAVRTKSPNTAEFAEDKWASYGVPLQGEFLKGVLAAVRR